MHRLSRCITITLVVAPACNAEPQRVPAAAGTVSTPPSAATPTTVRAASDATNKGTCNGYYLDHWNDPSNIPPIGSDQVFRLSQAFPQVLPEHDERPWLAFNPFIGDEATVAEQSEKYLSAVLGYILAGNIGATPSESDFTLCNNPVRPWFHVPWMDANPGKGREYRHGLTRELSPTPQKLAPTQKYSESAWAVGFYNARGAFVIGQIFTGEAPDAVKVPTAALTFPEGTVVGKALFTSASVADVPYLAGAPTWTANVMPAPCGGRFTGTAQDPRTNQAVPCSRRLTELRLAQFDVAVVDERAPLKWVFGTFLYNGEVDATRGWGGLEPVGLMWGNDPGLERMGGDPGENDPVKRGLTSPDKVHQSMMFTPRFPAWLKKDLGCAGRLDGPIDNPSSSCMSCHATASVPLVVEANAADPCDGANIDARRVVKAPIFGNNQCSDSGIDSIWFRNVPASTSIDDASICKGQKWVSLDYSLQIGEALTNYLINQGRPVEKISGSDGPFSKRAPLSPAQFPVEHLETNR